MYVYIVERHILNCSCCRTLSDPVTMTQIYWHTVVAGSVRSVSRQTSAPETSEKPFKTNQVAKIGFEYKYEEQGNVNRYWLWTDKSVSNPAISTNLRVDYSKPSTQKSRLYHKHASFYSQLQSTSMGLATQHVMLIAMFLYTLSLTRQWRCRFLLESKTNVVELRAAAVIGGERRDDE